jgi:LMBR1 domain-containing protein 1
VYSSLSLLSSLWLDGTSYTNSRCLFVIYGGVGLSAVPLDLINEYRNRPKRMKESEFVKARENLAIELVQLKEVGEQIRIKDTEARNATGWWSANRKRSAVKTNIKNYEIAVKDISKRHQLLQIQANYNRRAHPLFYVLKLILGLVFIVVSVLWILHM